MNKHYKHLGTVAIPLDDTDDGESFSQVHLYKVDEDENRFLHDLKLFSENPERYRKQMEEMGYWKDRIEDVEECETVENAVMSALGFVEEPDFAVPPGCAYHRYEISLMWGVVAICETTSLNV